MAATTNVQVIITAVDGATTVINGIGKSFQSSAAMIGNGAADASAANQGLSAAMAIGVAQTAALNAGAIVLSGSILLLAAGFAALSSKSIGMASDFQSAMLLIQTQAGASKNEVDKMSSAILGLAGKVGFAPQELAQGLYFVESAGYRGATALQVLTVAAEGAKTGHANLTDTVRALTSILSSGIKGVSDMSGAMGAVNAIIGTGKMTLDDFNAALGSGVLASSKVAGVSLQQLGAAMNTLVASGMTAGEASSRLNTLFQMMMSSLPKVKEGLSELGLSQKQLFNDMQSGGVQKVIEDFNNALHQTASATVTVASKHKLTADATIALKDSIQRTSDEITKMKDETVKGTDKQKLHNDAIQSAQDKLKGYQDKLNGAKGTLTQVSGATLDAADKAAILEKIFGVRETATFESLIGGAKTFNSTLTNIQKGSNDFKSNWAATEASNQAATERMNAQMAVLAVKWGNILLPAMTAVSNLLANTIIPIFQKFADFLAAHQTAMALFASVILSVVVTALIIMAFAIWSVVGAAISLGAAAALALLPWVLIGAAIVFVVILIVQHFNQIKQIAVQVGSAFQTLAHIFFDFFTGADITLKKNETSYIGLVKTLLSFRDNAIGVFNAIKSGISSALGNVETFVITTWTNITGIFNSFLKWITATFAPAFNIALNIIKFVFIVLWDFFVLGWAGIKLAMTMFINWLIATFRPLLSAVFNSIKEYLKSNIDFWVSVWNGIISLLTGVGSWLNTTFSPGIHGTFTFIGNLLTGVQEFFTKIWNGITDLMTRFANWLGKEWTGMLDKVFSWLNGALDKVSTWWQNIWNGISTFMVGLAGKIRDTVKGLLNDVIGFFNSLINGANTVGAKVPGFMKIPNIPKMQTGGYVPGPIGMPVPIIAHGGELVTPAGLASRGGGSQSSGLTIQVNVGMYAGSDTEKRNIAKQLYAALLQLAQSQHKSVQDYMGG